MSENEATETGTTAATEAALQADVDQAVLTDPVPDDRDLLAEVAGAIEAAGLAPEGDYDIVLTASVLFAELAATRIALAAAEHALEVAATAQASPSGAKGRKVGPLKDDPFAKYGEQRGAELLAAVQAAQEVEVAFSNGKSELPGLPAVRVEGQAWASTVVGLQLRLPELIVTGPAAGKAPWLLDGYGLLLDGKLAAYAKRGDVLEIHGGARMNLAPDICF